MLSLFIIVANWRRAMAFIVSPFACQQPVLLFGWVVFLALPWAMAISSPMIFLLAPIPFPFLGLYHNPPNSRFVFLLFLIFVILFLGRFSVPIFVV
jgi:hypothetical protein